MRFMDLLLAHSKSQYVSISSDPCMPLSLNYLSTFLVVVKIRYISFLNICT